LSKQNEIGDNLRKIYNHVKEAYILAKNGTKIGEINKAKRSKRKRRNYRYICFKSRTLYF